VTEQQFWIAFLALFVIAISAIAAFMHWHDRRYLHVPPKKAYECKPAAFIMTDWHP
jgi:hypothetical protein